MRNSAELPDARLDRDSAVPFHFQLAELLAREITSGNWLPGDRVAPEIEMSRHFEVSRATVRQAFGRLEQEGLITRHQGQGTFVKEARPRSWLLQASEGLFHDELHRMGRQVTSTVLRLDTGSLPTWACHALEVPDGTEGVTLERVRAVDGMVALYVVNHLPSDLTDTVLGLKDPNESLYERLAEREGITVAGGRRMLEAVPAGERVAPLLGLERDHPVAFVESVSWDEAGRHFDTYQAWVRTDRMKIEMEVAGHSEGVPVAASASHEAIGNV